MVAISAEQVAAIRAHAEAAYPAEACGLLIGAEEGRGRLRVSAVRPSVNVAVEARERSFEIDPALLLCLQRELRGGPNAVIGLYHSHPDQPAQPSASDLAMAWQDRYVWLIVSVAAGRATDLSVQRFDAEAARFEPLTLDCA
jgi:proteasome lid subunit RPN8/RPN11